jgi:uncharacterized phiE125 gp8 family phage protein
MPGESRAQYARVSGPSVEPLTLAEVKAHLRVTHSDEDDLITAYAVAARQWCEEYTRRSFIDTTWRMTMDSFTGDDDGSIWIERADVRSITSVVYTDSSGTQQTVAASVYAAQTGAPGRVYLRSGASWPTPAQTPASVSITFVAGYGAAASDVPRTVKSAILLMAANLYENREPVAVGASVSSLPLSVESLLWSERWSVK